MSEPELLRFIEGSRAAGASDDFIVTLLEDSRWPRKVVLQAFRDYYANLTGIALPDRVKAAESPRDAFFYLLSFSTLATWSWAAGSLFFHFIDRWFYDPIFTGNAVFATYEVPSRMAAILIAYPLYLFLMRSITQATNANPERLQSPVRKWLTYIALLFAAGFLIGDAITFLEYLLRGELSSRFLAKVVTVLFLAGGIFGYYLHSVRARPNE